jgi:hypothetical protein
MSRVSLHSLASRVAGARSFQLRMREGITTLMCRARARELSLAMDIAGPTSKH